MGFFSFFRKKPSLPEILSSELPWKDYPPIYTHINQHINPEGKLLESGETLPDEERRFPPGDLRWIAGGKDGAFGHHGGDGGDENKAKNVANLVNAIAQTGDVRKHAELYTILLDDDLIDFIDLSLNAIIAHKPPIKPHLRTFARWLVTESPDRGPLKFGIALLGLMRDESSIEDILLVGKHEEFTLFSAVAISNILEHPDPVLWKMAKVVDGWGRIHLVERLAGSKDASIKDWLLREGYKNQIMNEYLAYKCATSGELHTVLMAEDIDANLLTSAGELIMALITGIGGPAENIDDYEYAGLVIQEYLRHLTPQADQLAHLIIADTLYRFLAASDEKWKTRSQQHAWATVDRHQLTDITQQIIQKPLWYELVETHRQTEDEMLFWNVKLAARILQIDLWETYWARLQAVPDASEKWFDVMAHVNAERIGEVIQFAQTHLTLEDIATGPAKERGFGKEFKAHLCLDHVLGKLGQFPGYGELLIKAGLQSPVVRNRMMAIRALAAWGQAFWPEDMGDFLQDVQHHEPDEDVKILIQNVLKGESL